MTRLSTRSRARSTRASPLRPSPLCIRFRARDLSLVRQAAATEGELATVWIRETGLLLARSRAGLKRKSASAGPGLSEATKGACIAIRMSEADYEVIHRAAQRDGAHVGSWLRVVSVQRAKTVLAKSAKGKAA